MSAWLRIATRIEDERDRARRTADDTAPAVDREEEGEQDPERRLRG